MKMLNTCLLLLVILGSACFAQEKKEPKKKKSSGDMSFGFAMTRGNSETLTFSFSFGLKRKYSDKLEWLSSGFYLHNRDENRKTAESMGFITRLNWLKNKRFYSYYEFQVLRDIFRDYNYRLLPGAGLGYKLVELKSFELDLYGGLTRVITNYKSRSAAESFTGVKVGDRLTWKITANTELNQTAEFISRLSNLGEFFIRFEGGLAAAISKKWALSLSFVNTYDSKPSKDEIKKNEAAIIAGINYKF
jgi:putative salt-induced outer membrane protein YdiY